RAGHEPGRAVLDPEFVDHQDEPDHRPPALVPREVDVKPLRADPRMQRPPSQGTQLERLSDRSTARVQDRRKDVHVVELRAAIDESCTRVVVLPIDTSDGSASRIALSYASLNAASFVAGTGPSMTTKPSSSSARAVEGERAPPAAID